MAAFTNMPMDLVIVRHGQSEANMMIEMTKGGDLSGQLAMHEAKRHDSDMRLTDKGREQARAVGAWLREHAPRFDAFYCSQYVRTKETAAEMGLDGAQWHADLMIRERDQGVQDGGGDVKMNLDDEERFRAEKSPMYWQPIAGESMAGVVTRVRHFLDTLAQCSAGMRVVVVCHCESRHHPHPLPTPIHRAGLRATHDNPNLLTRVRPPPHTTRVQTGRSMRFASSLRRSRRRTRRRCCRRRCPTVACGGTHGVTSSAATCTGSLHR